MRTEIDLDIQGLSDALERVLESDRKEWEKAAFIDWVKITFYQIQFEVSCLKHRVNELEQNLGND